MTVRFAWGLAAVLALAAPARADTLLFWDFENAVTAGDISTAVGTPAAPGVTGFASQTGGGPAEDFEPFYPGAGLVHLTRFFGANRPYIEFTLSGPGTIDGVTFDHIHNHNFGYPTDPGYDVQLQLDSGSGYADVGAPFRAEGDPSAPPFDGTQSGYVAGTTVDLGGLALGPGTYRLRWDPRNLPFGTDTDTEYFALNDLRLNGSVVPAAVPEPASVALLALGGVGLVARRLRRS